MKIKRYQLIKIIEGFLEEFKGELISENKDKLSNEIEEIYNKKKEKIIQETMDFIKDVENIEVD